jgi:hypothetical protein
MQDSGEDSRSTSAATKAPDEMRVPLRVYEASARMKASAIRCSGQDEREWVTWRESGSK